MFEVSNCSNEKCIRCNTRQPFRVANKVFNPYLPYNNRIRDFIRWKTVGYGIVLYGGLSLIWGWWGLIATIGIDFLNSLSGGPVIDLFGEYPTEEILPIKCTEGIEDCKYCGNGYKHEFNVRKHKDDIIEITWKMKKN